MIVFKGCPRCRGDLHSRADMYGHYAECLQCGYSLDLQRAQIEALAAHASSKTGSKTTQAA